MKDNSRNEPIFLPSKSVRNPHSFTSMGFFGRGLQQLYEQPLENAFDISQINEPDLSMISTLSFRKETRYCPVVIVLRAHDIDSNHASGTCQISSSHTDSNHYPCSITLQITYANLVRSSDDSFSIKPLKQNVWYNGRCYVIHEMFGLENEKNEGGRECIICMSDSRDTVMLPCRHMCLCNKCAEELRHQSNMCPLCRSKIKHMVEIKISTISDTQIPLEGNGSVTDINENSSDIGKFNDSLDLRVNQGVQTIS